MASWPAAACCLFLLLLVPSVYSLVSSPASTSKRSLISPQGLHYFDFQKDAIVALINRPGGLLLCDEMGLGKTISAIGSLNNMKTWEKVLIVAPKSLLNMWESELERWLVVDEDSKTIGVATAKGGIPTHVNVLLMNYDIVEKYRQDIDQMGPWDVLICDECHYIKNGESRRTKAILGDVISAGTKKEAIPARLKWFLTGSPILNNPIELYPLLRALDPHGKAISQLREHEEFCDRYCGRRDTPWGVTYKGGKNLSELREKLRSGDPPLMLRRTKKEVLNDLPEKRHQLIPLDDESVAIQEEQTLRDALKTIGTVGDDRNVSSLKVVELKTRLQARGLPASGRKADLVERLRQYTASSTRARLHDTRDDVAGAQDTLEVFNSVGSALISETGGRRWEGLQNILSGSWFKGDQSSVILGALAQARHATAREKIPYAIEFIQSAMESHKVVVFAHHRDVQDVLLEAFGEDHAVVLHGGSTQEERSDVVERFQNDESVRLFIGSIRAAGVGITLTAASHVIFVEFDWSPLIIQQAEDRCHRVGQLSGVLVQYLFFRGTIDEHIASLLMSKQRTVAVALDAPTGASSWVFDFGKHKGKTVADVAAVDAGYLRWIVDQRVHIKRIDLLKALVELGYTSVVEADALKEDVKGASVDQARPREEVVQEEPSVTLTQENFIMPFGKHKGKPLGDIPKSYLGWLVSSGACRSNRQLNAALTGKRAMSSPREETSEVQEEYL